MKTKKIVLFGATGKLGKELIKLYDFIAPPYNKIDITNFDKTNRYLKKINPSIIIHTAALVGAKECEEDKEIAYKTNVIGTYNIAKICQKNNIKLIYISTDSIFDGEKGNYKEEDIPNPINYYSFTKFAGECFTQMVSSYLIIRTSFISKYAFPYEKAFTDQYTSRMPIELLAKDILIAMKKELEGIINIAGEKDTLYNIVKKINPNIGKITRAEINLNLPKDLSLNCNKWRIIKNGS